MPHLPHLYHKKKRGRRAQWGRQSNNSKLCSGRTTLLLRYLLTYREEWTKYLPANSSLLKKLLVWFIWRQSSVSLWLKDSLYYVYVSSDFMLPYIDRESYCAARLNTISCLIFGMYILDQGHSRGNRFSVLISLPNDICDLCKFFRRQNTWIAG